jgi:hypothetical protein
VAVGENHAPPGQERAAVAENHASVRDKVFDFSERKRLTARGDRRLRPRRRPDGALYASRLTADRSAPLNRYECLAGPL